MYVRTENVEVYLFVVLCLEYNGYCLLLLSGPSHSSEGEHFSVNIPTYFSGSVSMVEWSCRCRGFCYSYECSSLIFLFRANIYFMSVCTEKRVYVIA